jgi:hypothetical protein
VIEPKNENAAKVHAALHDYDPGLASKVSIDWLTRPEKKWGFGDGGDFVEIGHAFGLLLSTWTFSVGLLTLIGITAASEYQSSLQSATWGDFIIATAGALGPIPRGASA